MPALAQEAPPRPNFVVILVDDAALMDFGIYGGEARTPNIDALARRGAMFSHYRSSPLCSPSRAMLLTGVDNHRNGVATIHEVLPPEHVGQPGYGLALAPDIETLADRLGAAGYRTLMVGKWHMGSQPGDLPDAHGFDRSFALDASGADNWEDKSYMPFYRDAPWYENGKAVDLPEDFYSSQFIVDKTIDYLEDGDAEVPFLAYVAFQAIHIPLQAPPEFTAGYDGVYDAGWHDLRKSKHQRAQELGFVPAGAPLAPMPEDARDWASMDAAERELYARRMQLNAGMMEAMDVHIGRLIDWLNANNHYDDTVFVVTSDNGPEPNRGDDNWELAFWMHMNGYHVGGEGLGERGSWGFIGPEWANAAASPGALYKFYATEGGVRVPLIMAGPGIPAGRVGSAALVTDVMPTLLELAGTVPDAPAGTVPMTGRSLVPVLQGQAAYTYGADEPVAMEVSGNSALYLGDYKITRSVPPVGDGTWRLYNLAADPGETTDLSSTQPKTLARMLADYAAYETRMGILAMPDGYDSIRQVHDNARAKQRERYGWLLIPAGLVILILIFGAWVGVSGLVKRRRNRRA